MGPKPGGFAVSGRRRCTTLGSVSRAGKARWATRSGPPTAFIQHTDLSGLAGQLSDSAGSVVGPDILSVVAGDIALGPPLSGPLVTVVADHGPAGVCGGGYP